VSLCVCVRVCVRVRARVRLDPQQAGAVALGNGPLDDPVPPLPAVEGLEAEEGQQHPQVLHAVLDGGS